MGMIQPDVAFVSLSAPGVITYQVLDMQVACYTVVVCAAAEYDAAWASSTATGLAGVVA